MFVLLFTLAHAAIVPASEVEFEVQVSGTIAEIEVRQTFRNDSPQRVDATYRFPLHAKAVVDGMQIRLEDRTIDGVIKEKEEARKIYEEAVAAGQTAALTETERWNLYKQEVGNIPPGAELEVILRLVQPVDRVGRGYELSLPVGNAGSFEDEASPAPSASVAVEIDVGLPLKDVNCVTHQAFEAPTGEGWSVLLSDVKPDTGPVVVRWDLKDPEAQIGAVYDEEHVMLLFDPPVSVGPVGTLQVALISESSFQNVALQVARSLNVPVSFVGDVGAEIRRRRALKASERQPVLVVVGDGHWQDEALLDELDSTLHLFPVGGSASANRYYLDDLAARSGGRAFYTPHDLGSLAELMVQPTLSQIQIDWGDWGEAELAGGIPDVRLGQPVEVLARTAYSHGGVIELSGWVGDERREFRIEPRSVTSGRGLGSTWARARIEALGRKQIRGGESAREEGLPLALEYGILSPWTAFVAVDPRVHRAEISSLQQDESTSTLTESHVAYTADAAEVVQKVSGTMSRDFRYKQKFAPVGRKRRATRAPSGGVAYDAPAVAEPMSRSRGVSSAGWNPRPTGAAGANLEVGIGDVALAAAYDRAGVDGGRWEQLPVQLLVRSEGNRGHVGYTRQRLTAPVLTEPEVKRDVLDVGLDLHSDPGWLELSGLVQSLTCSRCTPTRTMGIDVSGERMWTVRGVKVGIGASAATGQVRAHQPTDTAAFVIGPSVSASWNPKRATGFVRIRPQLGFPVDPLFMPSLDAEIGPRFGRVSVLLGGAQDFDTSRPMWGVPRTRTAWAGVGVGKPRPWGRLRAGWEELSGPLAPRLELVRALEEGSWRRSALIADLSVDFQRDVLELGWSARITRVLSSDANLTNPVSPYVPGLLRAHRPFLTQGTAKLHWGSSHFRLDGGLGSPLPVTGWWGRWQAHAALGVAHQIEFAGGALGANLTGEVWSGRPGEADPRRLDGWVSPDRAGLWAARAGVTLRL